MDQALLSAAATRRNRDRLHFAMGDMHDIANEENGWETMPNSRHASFDSTLSGFSREVNSGNIQRPLSSTHVLLGVRSGSRRKPHGVSSGHLQQSRNSARADESAVFCFRASAATAILVSLLGACTLGASGILNVDYKLGRPQKAPSRHHKIANSTKHSRGRIITDQRCVLNTGWNFSTGCQVCDPNWTGEDCDECSENHYGPLCLPCKCALYDHSFDLANEDRYLDCNEGVNGDGTCTIVTSVLDAFWIVVSILAIVVLSNMLMLVNCFARSYQNCTRRCVQSSDNSNPRQNSGPPYSDTKNAETRNDAAVVSCSTTVLLCCTFAAGSVGKLPLRFRRFFVGSTILLSLSSFSVMYAVIGQNLALSPRWMLIWYGAILLLNVSSFGLLNLLIFEVGAELYSKMRAEQRTNRYRNRFFNEREESRALKEGWIIDGNSIKLKDKDTPIGEGTSGAVFEAIWDPLADQGACVAVKVIKGSSPRIPHGDGISDTKSDTLKDFMDLAILDKEIELMQRLSHPRLVHFFGAGRLGFDGTAQNLPSSDSSFNPDQVGCIFLLTELMSGGDLGQLLSEQLPYSDQNSGNREIESWPWSARLQILSDIASGMQYLHSHSVAHRDLKPGNVLLDKRRMRAKVADFGLAKLLRDKRKGNRSSQHRQRNPVHAEAPDEGLSYSENNSGKSQPLFTLGTGSFATGRIGSAAYMSPELWLGERVRVDQYKADVYAMSVCMWRVMECPRMPYIVQGWQPQFNAQLKHMVAEQGLRPLIGEELEEAVLQIEDWANSLSGNEEKVGKIGDSHAQRQGVIHDKFQRHWNALPEGFTDLMLKAWDTNAIVRPTMAEISHHLRRMLAQSRLSNKIVPSIINTSGVSLASKLD